LLLGAWQGSSLAQSSPEYTSAAAQSSFTGDAAAADVDSESDESQDLLDEPAGEPQLQSSLPRIWTKEMDNILIEGVLAGDAEGTTRNEVYTAVATSLSGKTVKGVFCRANRLITAGLLPRIRLQQPLIAWSDEENAILSAAAADCSSVPDATNASLPNLPGRSFDATRSHIRHLLKKGMLRLQDSHFPASSRSDALARSAVLAVPARCPGGHHLVTGSKRAASWPVSDERPRARLSTAAPVEEEELGDRGCAP